MTRYYVGTSTDGINWAWTSPGAPFPFGESLLEGELVGFDSNTGRVVGLFSGSANHLAYSSNAVAWTSCTVPGTVPSFGGQSSFASNGAGVNLLTGFGSGALWISSDMITWTNVATVPGTMGTVAWDPVHSQFIGSPASGVGAQNVYSSTNGTSWSLIATDPFHPSTVGGLYAAGSFVYAFAGAFVFHYSTDGGVTWSLATDTNGTWFGIMGGVPTQIVYNGTTYVMVAPGGTATNGVPTLTSTNGTSWTENTGFNPNQTTLYTVAYSSGLGLFVTGGSTAFSATNKMPYYSAGGTSWTEGTLTSPTPSSTSGGIAHNSIVWDSSLSAFVAVGIILTTTGGSTAAWEMGNTRWG